VLGSCSTAGPGNRASLASESENPLLTPPILADQVKRTILRLQQQDLS
jgi:hypothetical protein